MVESISIIVFAVCLTASYFIGNMNPSILLAKARGIDIRKEGSGNAGTTNTLRVVGKKAAILVLAVDILKGVLVVILAGLFSGPTLGVCCGTAVIIGHVWPVCFRFKGGKGAATTFGVVVAIKPVIGLLCLAVVILVFLISRRVSLGSIIGAASMVPFTAIFLPQYIWFSVVIAAILIWKHHENIKRLIKGEEPKTTFGKKRKTPQ